MFKKFNWGWGIAIFYSSFVVFMLLLVWYSTKMKTELVTADYYNKELKYQEQLDKIKRAGKLSEPVRWTVENNKVTLSFPTEVKTKNAKAEVLFYRPNSSAGDFNVSCVADSTGTCQISSEKFRHGVYKIEVDWSADNNTYYTEGVINMN
jgi:hypothetical protein